MLIRVDDVYAVLRSKQPLRPTREFALALLDKALASNSGTQWQFNRKAELLEEAHQAISSSLNHCDAPSDLDDIGIWQADATTLIPTDRALALLRREQPAGPNNAAAVELLNAVDEMASRDPRKVVSGHQLVVSGMGSALAIDAAANGRAPTDAQLLNVIQGLTARLALMDSRVVALDAKIATMDGRMGAAFDELQENITVGSPKAFADAVAEGVAAERKSRWSSELLSNAISRFVVEKVQKDKIGLKHYEDVQKRLAIFLTFVGDKAVRDVTRDDLKSYRDHLDRLPDRAILRLKTDDVRKAVELNSTLAKPIEVIGPITVDLKYLGPVGRFFDWLVDEEQIERNPAQGIKSGQIDDVGAKFKRHPLKPDQINRLFAVTARKSRVTAFYWVPPLMLFTGARINELAQLRTSDLCEHNGRVHLNVLCLKPEADEPEDEAPVPTALASGDERSAKSAAARRLIPIHNELIRMGFLGFVESRRRRVKAHCQLFSELEANRYGHWSAAISKALNRQIRKLGITNPVFSAYSLRHNFYDGCVKNKIAPFTRKKFMGHQLPGMDGVYGNPEPLQEESDEIDLLAYPAVDLSPYLKGK
ncbi:integrase [Bosea sp. BE271]|nr:integrase [Bosea robiniae]MDR6894606.1 integrase [Bosea sp. BE109]MDR7137806.1 integrase [Bosea sp. BE168]MDR7174505.1 integrase [Bosea sp. BE271]